MSKSLETKSYMVGGKSSYHTSSKSMLSTIKLGCIDTEDIDNILAASNPEPVVEITTTLKTGFEQDNTPVISQPIVELPLIKTTFKTGFEQDNTFATPKPEPVVEKPLLKTTFETTFKTGFEHDDVPVISQPIVEFKQSCQKHEDSVIDSVDTGFGECKTIENSCPKPTFKSHLYKENYLSEFKTETEKALARSHLGVYGKSEMAAVIKQEIGNLQSFVKKEEVEKMIADLDFVNSTLKAFADYQIPEKLFKL